MNPTLLLIEDNEKNRYLATFLLEERGYRVVHAPDGPRGIALAQELRPDLIVLDIQLPGMDGHAVARALRHIEHTRSVPISSPSPPSRWWAIGRKRWPPAATATLKSRSTRPLSLKKSPASVRPSAHPLKRHDPYSDRR